MIEPAKTQEAMKDIDLFLTSLLSPFLSSSKNISAIQPTALNVLYWVKGIRQLL